MSDKDRIPLASRAMSTAFNVMQKAHVASSALLSTVALSLLDDDELQAMTRAYYARSPTYGSNEHNLKGLFDWEEHAIAEYFHLGPGEGKILVTSAGGGREVIALAEKGWQVVATECVDELVTAMSTRLTGRIKDGRVRIIHHDPYSIPGDLGRFEAAIVGWGGYSHMQGRDRRILFLENLRRSLVPGASVLLSFLGSRKGIGRKDRAVGAIARLHRRLLGRSALEMGVTVDERGYIYRFSDNEVRSEFETAGFVLIYESWSPYPHTVAMNPFGR